MIADIQILRDHVKHVGLSYIFRCLSVNILLAVGGTLPWVDSGFSQVKHLSFLDKKGELQGVQEDGRQVVQGDKLVPGQNHTGRELLGCSEIICSAPQPQGRLSSTLVLPSGCCPAVKSYRETGSAFLPSKSNTVFVFVVWPECFFCTSNPWPLCTCGHWEEIGPCFTSL